MSMSRKLKRKKVLNLRQGHKIKDTTLSKWDQQEFPRMRDFSPAEGDEETIDRAIRSINARRQMVP